jgi:hypothetical protein
VREIANNKRRLEGKYRLGRFQAMPRQQRKVHRADRGINGKPMREDTEKLREQLAPMLALSKAALRDLAAGNGTYWKEAVGELHSQNQEIPLWVLLYEDSNLLEAHKALCRTLRPHIEGLAPNQIVLFYEIIVGDNVSFAKLHGNESVFSGKIDLRWIPSERGASTVFVSRDSKRPD